MANKKSVKPKPKAKAKVDLSFSLFVDKNE